MFSKFSRRSILAAGALILSAAVSVPAIAQEPVELRFSAVFSDQDIRARMMERFTEELGDEFQFQGYYGGNLFKQGTELVALQRGNLEMGNIGMAEKHLNSLDSICTFGCAEYSSLKKAVAKAKGTS